MINLLPPELKESYRYAYRNVRLMRWVVASVISLLGLAALGTGGLIYIQQTTQSYVGQIAAAESDLHQQKLAATQAQVKDISNSLKLAVQVLSKEVLFSDLLTHLASITPSNAVLTDLTISQSEQAIGVTALTTSYNAATQLQVNLADPANKLFSKADIVSITCSNAAGGSGDSQYPCSVTIRALFVTNNPYLFVNDGKTQ